MHSDSTIFFHGYVVEITGVALHESWRADLMSDGTFTLREVPKGDYLLKIMGYQGGVVKEEFVTVRDHPATIEVTLPHEDRTAPGGPVSLRELQHPPAAKAVRLAASAQRFAQEGDQGKAIEELQKAIRISPDYAAAHTNLGAVYIRMKDYQAARQEIRKALDIGGPNAVDLCNLAFIETTEHQYGEALETVKAALRVDPSNANGHYILGTLLLLDQRTAQEGIRNLELAAPTVAGARETLARVRGQ